MHHRTKTRSRTGCRSCRIRKVKCDEEKLRVQGHEEPQCRRCTTDQILCEWKGGPIPRKSARVSSPKRSESTETYNTTAFGSIQAARQRMPVQDSPYPSNALLLPYNQSLQAANSLSLSAFDRKCLNYLEDSALISILGKHWTWSIVRYVSQRIAVKEPMVMSMMLASTAREIHRCRLHDSEDLNGRRSIDDSSHMDGRVHYGRALAGLRETLKHDVKSPGKVEAVLITIWLMIDYEYRFGIGAAAINIHLQGVESFLFTHVVALLKHQTSSTPVNASLASLNPSLSTPDGLLNTSVPRFLLWTIYLLIHLALVTGSSTAKLDTHLLQYFLRNKPGITAPSRLSELYCLSKQSPAILWGDDYPLSARLDDVENYPALTLYHRSHVVQFRIAELFKHGPAQETTCEEQSPYQHVVDEINSMSIEYDSLLNSAKAAQSCEVGNDGRRVMETVLWASITYYSTIVYFYLCFKDVIHFNNLITLESAVSRVLELSLKLHRSRPQLMVRVAWPLFIAGIATSDCEYQNWVSMRMRELCRYGQNFSRISSQFDQIVQGGDPYGMEGNHFLRVLGQD